ncbi:MAG: hypothetical protein ACPL3B_05910 [Fervidobacterium sp.]
MSTTDSFQKDTSGALWYPSLNRWIVELTMPIEFWDEVLDVISEALETLKEVSDTIYGSEE